MSTLGNALGFLKDFGFFDVILPFLLVFAVVFGILEKTKIFGTEKIGDVEYSKKNIDAIVAFVIAMFVVAATKIVDTMQLALPRVALLLVVSLSFLLMIGIFIKPEGFYEQVEKTWLAIIMIIMFIAVILIFLSVIPANDGESWLEYSYNYVMEYWTGALVGSIILFILVIGAVLWITKTGEGEKKEKG